MFSQIFLFEIRYRTRRPAFYVYLLLVLVISILVFAKGDMGREKEWINSPVEVAQFLTGMSMFLMLVSSALMGTPLYRDLEHNTKEYYLSYPITKAGYFWGRFFGSFFFVLLISFALVIGAWIGSALGPVLGWNPASSYGPNRLSTYLFPWLWLVVPTLFFTSAFFFGLVAVFRDVKVIYSSGMFFFLGYIIGNFFLHNIQNNKVIYLADPFLQNGMRLTVGALTGIERNHFVIPTTGLMLSNRLLWLAVGAAALGFTWWYFSFERFFSGRASKDKGGVRTVPVAMITGFVPHIELRGAYHRRILFSLTRIELLNIIRDNYFWIILSGGYIFLSFVFWHGPGRYDVHDYPRTVFFVDVFADVFLFFVFLIIVFYTGETVHREKLTRFAFINDSLPPPDWVFNSAKLLSLCVLALFLALTPALLGLPIQLLQGYHHFNLGQYFESTVVIILPKLVLMVLLCFSLHLIINNKFAGHGVAITVWTAMFILVIFRYVSYFLLMYSYTPMSWASDMDGIGHMVKPILWFQSYWALAGLLLVMVGVLFYARGVPRSFRERLRLARDRFHGPMRMGVAGLMVVFLAVGGWIYYNVSYLNDYTTRWENSERRALAEKALKRYASLPLPRMTRLKMNVELFPAEQREETTAWVRMVNDTRRTIDTLLIDGDGLEFEISRGGVVLPYSQPLYYPRAKFSLFRGAKEPSDYRMYVLAAPMRPGDSAEFLVRTTHAFPGFQNNLYAAGALHNGMITPGNLPALGYDADEEIGDNDIRKSHGLQPMAKEVDIPWDDSVGRRSLAGKGAAGMIAYDLTVSTVSGQSVAASGRLEREYVQGDRHVYHFVQDSPGIYAPAVMLSARHVQWTDTVRLDDGRVVGLEIDYHPAHAENVPHFAAAMKDGLRYYSRAFGPYPYDRLVLAESPAYTGRRITMPGVLFIPEQEGWNADLRPKESFDYLYYLVALELAHEWWGQAVAPNNTLASRVMDVGVPRYAALALLAQRADSGLLKHSLDFAGWDYEWQRRGDRVDERPLIRSNKWYQWDAQTTLHLWALAQAIGVDSVNSALRDLYGHWALRAHGPYVGAHDLYDALAAHVPDSVKPWLAAEWEKVPTGAPTAPHGKLVAKTK